MQSRLDNKKNKKRSYIILVLIIISIFILCYVLYKKPIPGVADQGDFDRIMYESGLELFNENKVENGFNRFYDYIVTNYKISNIDTDNENNTFIKSSLSYFIILINFICKLFNSYVFKTNYLSLLYSIIYISSIAVILKFNNIRNRLLLIIGFLGILIFLDGNYLVWFNSLYGEPMMIVSLMLFIASYKYYAYKRFNALDKKGINKNIILLFISAMLFLGSKMQVITALPFILILLVRILIDNKRVLNKASLIGLNILLLLIIIYPISMNRSNSLIGKDTQYNSVFYGVLKDSNNPREDLISMGLNPDMEVEAGKHSYLNESEYEKYVPRTEITEDEFYSRISNIKLIKFYLTHPKRLIDGMKSTAKNAFITSTFLGKYSIDYSSSSIREFNRFTLWSNIRDSIPKNFLFICIVYLTIIIYSIIMYFKNSNKIYLKRNIELFWSLIGISIIQYPMPFVGNGYADIAKQLYLFNFIFDIIIYVIISYIFYLVKREFMRVK
ncbi:hypothetical protein [Clostridium sp.]|uniref:glycan biosynthesis hexose transferase WsfD n=1 Tax=Clostridium sp. TaxID=1506 RepID=UPI0025BEAD7D|nr:hypothetical protein [Clostridium sp.]